MGRLKGLESDAVWTPTNPIVHVLRHIAPIEITRKALISCITTPVHENVSVMQDLMEQKYDIGLDCP